MTSTTTHDRREVRWIIEGAVPVALRPAGRPRRRRDHYELDSLTSWHAAKRRGTSRALEHKLRMGRVEHVEWSGVDGFIETWRKAPAVADRIGGTWVRVDKELWSFGHLEICHFRVGDANGWTVCVDIDRRATSGGSAVFERWLPELGRRGSPDSYPSWLARRLRRV